MTSIHDQGESIEVGAVLIARINKAISAALEYERATKGKRRLGITGEVGEVLVCRRLGLRLMLNPRSEGYDAVDSDGKLVQIKTRRGETADVPRGTGRLGTFSKHKYDYALFGVLDSQYRLTGVWRADYLVIEPIVAKTKRRNPSISSFLRNARKVFPLAVTI